MKKRIASVILLLAVFQLSAQDNSSPYEWDWTTDGIWTGTALAGSTVGFILIQNKDDITEEKLSIILSKEDNINFLDRWAVGKNSEAASKASDIPFAASFVAPFFLLLDDETNDHTGQILGLYLESLATTASLYTLSAGLINRSRPYVYDEENSITRRLSGNGQRSFFSGHVAATTTATFFTAKVLTDFNPNIKGKFWVWTGAAVIPAAVGYYRIEAGQHFLTDVLLGYGLGAVTGYFVPELHKTNRETKLSIAPTNGLSLTGDNYQGLAFRYTF